MVIVDTTVWIDYLGGNANAETEWLDREMPLQRIGLTDTTLCEVLQGIRDTGEFRRIRDQLLRFDVFSTGVLKTLSQPLQTTTPCASTRGATLVAPPSVHWEVGNALSAMFKRKAIGLDEALKLLQSYAAIPIRLTDLALRQGVELAAELNIYAYDAYVIACAVNHRAPILTLDSGLRARARELKLNVLEVKVR